MRLVLILLMALAWSAPSLIFPTAPAWAVNPDEVLSDPLLEKRAREISKGLRCLVCQNQSIDDSDAGLAKDLRVLVRERLVAGDSDSTVLEYVVSRYGDFVLLKPPFKGATLVLWLGPLVFVGFGLFAMIAFMRRRRTSDGFIAPSGSPGDPKTPTSPKPLTADEKRRIDELLKDDNA